MTDQRDTGPGSDNENWKTYLILSEFVWLNFGYLVCNYCFLPPRLEMGAGKSLTSSLAPFHPFFAAAPSSMSLCTRNFSHFLSASRASLMTSCAKLWLV